MSNRSRQVSRRTLLRGCGAAMALPWLEAMAPTRSVAASATVTPPTRAAFFYIPNGVVQSAWHPEQTGERFELSPTLQPLAPVRDKIALFTHLDRIKVHGTDGHAQAGSCWLSSAAPDQLSPAGYPLRQTLDQIIAAKTGQATPFRSLELSCNSFTDNKESIYFDAISWYGHGHVARSIRDPRRAFNRLFAVREQSAERSVLDLVMEDAKSLRRRLGVVDQTKLDEYMDSVRAVESQIERLGTREEAIAALDAERPAQHFAAMERHEYIQLMGDLMILAFRADLTRVATLMVGPERWSTPQQVHGLFEKPVLHHSMTHGQGDSRVREDLERLDRYHVDQFARLVAKMDAIEEGDGTLLDHAVFTLGSGLSSGKTHIYSDLPTVIAGRGGGAIRTDIHHRSQEGTPLANLWLSIARLMGVDLERFADSTGPIAV